MIQSSDSTTFSRSAYLESARRSDSTTDSKAWTQALGILAAATLLRILLAVVVPLYADEAYYWEWSRHLASGYFDHPPVIAWLVAGGTALFGDTSLGVRLLPLLAGSAGGLAIALTARHLAGGAAARFAALVVVVMPLAAGGLVLATPDAPLFAGIAFTVLGVARAVDERASAREALGWWMLAGAAIGLAMTSKFTGVLIPFGVLAGVALDPTLRPQLRRSGPWLAVAVASIVMIPVLTWNASHEWVAFKFQVEHGLGDNGRGNWWSREISLLLGQLGLVSPLLLVLFVGRIASVYRGPRDPVRSVLASVTAFVMLFFLVSALRRPVEANWPAVAWVPAIVLLAAARSGQRTRLERAAVIVGAVLSLLAIAHVIRPYVPIPPTRDASIKSFGWEALAREVDVARRTLGAQPTVVAANRYQDAALLAFHLQDQPTVYALNIESRPNQYDLWPPFRERASRGATLLLVLDIREERGEETPSVITQLAPHFAGTELGAVVPLARGDAQYGARRLWVLTGWRGSWPVDSTDLPNLR